MNGGRQQDVEDLIRGIAGHSFYLSFHDNPYANPEGREISDGEVSSWFKRLSREWPEKRDPADPAPTTVSDQVRANVRGEIREQIEEFIPAAACMSRIMRSCFQVSKALTETRI